MIGWASVRLASRIQTFAPRVDRIKDSDPMIGPHDRLGIKDSDPMVREIKDSDPMVRPHDRGPMIGARQRSCRSNRDRAARRATTTTIPFYTPPSPPTPISPIPPLREQQSRRIA